jgi:hypothetical protein
LLPFSHKGEEEEEERKKENQIFSMSYNLTKEQD